MFESKKSNNTTSTKNLSPIVWHLLLTIGVVVVLFYSLVASHRMMGNYVLLSDGTLKIQVETALGHLWFEEILSGDSSNDISIVWEHFDRAEIFAKRMVEGEGRREKMFLLLRDPALHHELEGVLGSLQSLRAVASKRWEARSESQAGTPVDEEFDALFAIVLSRTSIVEATINEMRADDLRTFQKIQGVTIVVVLGLLLFSGIVFRRFERKQYRTYLALAASEYKTRSTFNALSDAVFLHPFMEEGFASFVDANQTACQMYGYTEEEFLNLSANDISKKIDTRAHGARSHRKELIDAGQLIFESTHITKNGMEFPVEINSTIIELEGKRMIMAVVRDISDRKASEALLHASQENYEILFDESPIPLWVEDFSAVLEYFEDLKLEGVKDFREYFEANDDAVKACAQKLKVIKVNKASVALHKADSKDQLLGNLDKTFTDKSYEVFRNELIAVASGQLTFESEAEVKTIDGALRNVFLNLTINPPSMGSGMAMLATFDITEKTKLEAQFRQAQKMESVGLLAGGVAHDFNNMLAVILGNTELAFDEVNEHQPIYGMLEGIERAGKRSADLTRQLLAFARKQTIAPQVLNLDDVVNETLKMLRRIIGENIELVWLPGSDSSSVKVDPTQIDQILTNLCVNARDAIDAIGKVTIETTLVTFDEPFCSHHPGSCPGDFVLLTVSDNGCGMEKEILNRIYEPFFSTKPSGEGSGLGMATVYGIIKQNSGFIDVYSELGVGTTIKVFFPHYKGKVADYQPSDAKSIIPKGTETILLVEDESSILDLTTTMLQKHGYTVLPATSPEIAMELVGEHGSEIHLLLTDVVMPGMSGVDLSAELRRPMPDLKCLFMSGYTANVIAHDGILDEDMDFIQKPFAMHDLLATVRNVLDS